MQVKNININTKLLKRINRYLSKNSIEENSDDKILLAYNRVLDSIYNLQYLLDCEIK